MAQLSIIHVVSQSAWGGAEIYAVDLAARQLALGYQVAMVAPSGSPTEKMARERGLDVVSHLPLARFGVFGLQRWKRHLIARGASHLHLHGAKAVSSLFGIKWLLPIQVLLHLHIWPGLRKRDLWHRWVYSGVDQILVAGQKAKEAVLQTLPVPPEKVSIVRYGLDLGRFTDGLRETSRVGLPEGEVVFGVFSRIDRQKGIIEFLEGLELALRVNPRLRGLIMGGRTLDDPDSKIYESEIQDWLDRHPQVSSRVRILGFSRDYLSTLASVDVMVLPSYRETYSLTILDAFMLRIPVLGTDAGGTPDLIGDKRGWLVPPRDCHALAQRLLDVAGDREEIERRGRCAHDYVVREHHLGAIMARLEEIYRK